MGVIPLRMSKNGVKTRIYLYFYGRLFAQKKNRWSKYHLEDYHVKVHNDLYRRKYIYALKLYFILYMHMCISVLNCFL